MGMGRSAIFLGIPALIPRFIANTPRKRAHRNRRRNTEASHYKKNSVVAGGFEVLKDYYFVREGHYYLHRHLLIHRQVRHPKMRDASGLIEKLALRNERRPLYSAKQTGFWLVLHFGGEFHKHSLFPETPNMS
jgi:hypothetical protein